jgi:release factor glutamine methyltransferase
MASEQTPPPDEEQTPVEEPWTYKRLLSWTTDFLRERGSDSPQLDGQVLLAHAAGCDRLQLFTSFDTVASESTRTTFRQLVKRRADGVPVAYLVGSKEFYSLAFRVTPDVLVPRPETEHLVVALLDQIKELGSDTAVTIADIGTGSGCIAITAAKHAPQCRLFAVDQSESALAIAKQNAESHAVADRIDFLHGDLLAPLPQDTVLDFIVSNPPYVSEQEFAELEPTVRDHEPRAALVSGPAGTEIIQRLLAQAVKQLRSGGWLFIEISPMIEAQVSALINATAEFTQHSTIKDLAGHARVVQVQRA